MVTRELRPPMVESLVGFPLTSQCLLLCAIILTLLLCLYKPIYNIYFHPCAKFPGPWTRAAFQVPFHWEQFLGVAPQNTHELHEKYGPVVRLGPDRLSFVTSQAYRDIYGFRNDRSQIPKDHKRFPIGTQHMMTLLGSNDADHTRLRRVIAHSFSETGLRGQEAQIQSHLRGFISLLHRLCTTRADTKHESSSTCSPSSSSSSPTPTASPLNLDTYLDYLSFDILSALTYGESFACIARDATHPFITEIYRGCHILPAVLMAWDYRPLEWVLRLVRSKRVQNAWEGKTNVLDDERIRRRLDEGEGARVDFMTNVIKHNLSPHRSPITPLEIRGLALIIMAAGSEEPASLIAAAIFHLVQEPAKLARLQAELDATYADASEITFSSLPGLTYLNAVVKEALRIRPPSSGHNARRTVGEVVVDGWVVPGGIALEVPAYAAGRSTRNWVEPDNFHPERFLPDAPKTFGRDDKEALQPFMLGPRGCVGKNLALIMIRSTIANLLWHFDVEMADPGQRWLENQPFRTVWHRPGLMVNLTPREGRFT